MTQRATILDVARAAGVSKATVSRVLGGTYPVATETADRVHAAVASLRYTASTRARSLANGRSDAIAVIVSEPLDTFFADPTFARILKGITDALSETPIVPILLPTATSQEQGKALHLITSQTVDAVIHLSPWADQGLLQSLRGEHVPVVLCGQDHRDEWGDDFSFVYSDDRLGAIQAGEHLRALGRSKPLAILGEPDQPAASDRLKGYQDVFPSLTSERVKWGGWSAQAGAEAMGAFLAERTEFDCLLAASDRIARGALEVLLDRGIRVPDDVAIIGYDDHPLALDMTPQLTTVAQPMHAQGEAACAIAREMVTGAAPRTVLLPTELRVRGTA